MSEADKMFEKLGYEKENNIDYFLYRKKYIDNNFIEIVFDLENYLLNIRTEDVINYQTITSILNIKELQAINKKCKELGWI